MIKDELQFDRNLDKRAVKDKVAWFARNQEYLNRVSDRANPYLFHIITKLQERDMPLDLALLPIVESAYQPFAYSPSHASGIWQFIPTTGKRYGMKQNCWYDGRRDTISATDGALDYLQDLHKRFKGNWLHTLAAYNSGEGYVPSLLVMAEVLKNSDKYKLSFKAIPNKPYFENINIGSQIDLATVSKLFWLDHR